MSRELDSVIATEVMGWTMVGDTYANWVNAAGEYQEPAEGVDEAWWSPSTDIKDAWQVVEKMTTTTKQWFRLEKHSTGSEATFEIMGAGDADRTDTAEAATDAEAICLAALAAVRGK